MTNTQRATLYAAAAITAAVCTFALVGSTVDEPYTVTPPPTQTVGETKTARPYEVYIVTSEPTEAPRNEMHSGVRFKLTPEERTHVERVVMGEAGNQGTEGQMLVAQCILNACELDGLRPAEVTGKYQYAGYSEAVTDEVRASVANVFDAGEKITDEPVMYFYAYKTTDSAWHESQEFVLEYKDHRFFKEASV